MASMSAMSAVHENVHQRAKQQDRVGPPLRQVGSMLRPQKVASHRADHQEAVIARSRHFAGCPVRVAEGHGGGGS
jgi:hypothetical protein